MCNKSNFIWQFMKKRFKILWFLILFQSVTNYTGAQHLDKSRFILYDQPYDFSFGLKFGNSIHSPFFLGSEINCRWFGIGFEVNPFVMWRPENYLSLYPYFLQERIVAFDVHAHFRYLSIGCAYGMISYSCSNDSIFAYEKAVFFRPFVTVYVPLSENGFMLNATIGYEVSKLKQGLYFGLGIFKIIL